MLSDQDFPQATGDYETPPVQDSEVLANSTEVSDTRSICSILSECIYFVQHFFTVFVVVHICSCDTLIFADSRGKLKDVQV